MKKLFGPFLYTPTTSIKYISFIFCVNISIFPVFCFQYILYTNVLIMHFKFEASFKAYLLPIIGIFLIEYIYYVDWIEISIIPPQIIDIKRTFNISIYIYDIEYKVVFCNGGNSQSTFGWTINMRKTSITFMPFNILPKKNLQKWP